MARRPTPPARSGDPVRGAHAAALGMVARRELSAAQVRQRLVVRGFPSDAIETAIARLTADGAINDQRTARAIARTEALKHRGPSRIRLVLERAGLARDLARDAVQETFADTSEREALERALARRGRQRPPNLRDPADLRRTRDYLLRQGFSASAVSDVLNRHRRRRGERDPDDDGG